ncbi:UNVERIFIED_CONTAM: hypothetical protein RMT77_011464 [Armadillidium vulgare]
MKLKFKYFEYDLSQNLVHFSQKKCTTLYIHSLILSIAYAFKDSEIIEEIIKTIDSLEDPHNLTNNDIIKIEEIESKVKNTLILNSREKLNPELTKPFYEWFIHYVLMQILDFFIKGAMHNSIPLNVYLENLTFTTQGTINLKKTILRILQRSPLPLPSKFVVACHYFVDNSFIRKFYHTFKNEKEEKYFTENSKFITDYSLYYWMWQIHGKRTLVTEASSFYAQSDNSWSRSDLSNDTAVLFIFKKAVKDNNELAVQHLWTDNISKMTRKFEILGDVLKLASTDPAKINIFLYLLFQIGNNGTKYLFKCISHEIMKNVIKNIRWYALSTKILRELKTYLSQDNAEKLLYITNENNCFHNQIKRAYSMVTYLYLMPLRTKLKISTMEFVFTLNLFVNGRDELMRKIFKLGKQN